MGSGSFSLHSFEDYSVSKGRTYDRSTVLSFSNSSLNSRSPFLVNSYISSLFTIKQFLQIILLGYYTKSMIKNQVN